MTPSFQDGFARSPDESVVPEQWLGLLRAWAPCLGYQGGRLYDVSGDGREGSLTLMDPATDWVVRGAGVELSFDGSNDYVNAGTILSPANGSMMAWIRPLSQQDNQCVMGAIDASATDTTARYVLIARVTDVSAAGDWGTLLSNDSTSQFVFSGQVYNDTNFPVGVLTQVAITYDGTSVVFYKDGLVVNTVGQTAAGAATTLQPFSIGRLGAYDFPFHGEIAQVRIYGRTLLAADVRAMAHDPLALYRLRPRRRARRAQTPAAYRQLAYRWRTTTGGLAAPA
jgi:hypothetical protein